MTFWVLSPYCPVGGYQLHLDGSGTLVTTQNHMSPHLTTVPLDTPLFSKLSKSVCVLIY